MTALEVAAELEARGLRLHDQGGQLAVSPRSAITDADRDALRAHKVELLALVRWRKHRVANVSLHQLDRVLEVAVPWSDVRLIIAPGCRVARELRASDPMPGRIWCSCEVLDLLFTAVPPDDARRIGQAKIAFGGKLVACVREQ